MADLTEEQVRAFEGCLTLPEDMVEATDFKAEEAIKLDMSIKLPKFFSLGEWIYETQNQGNLGSCTAMGTTHATQILNVKKKGEKPTKSNIITPDWHDLWSKMGHSTTIYDGGDYVEKAVSTALKQGIKTLEKGDAVKFDGYAYGAWNSDDKSLEMMRRYIYNGNPLVRCIKGNKTTRNEMTKGRIETTSYTPTGGHCIAVVGFDEGGFWFINSWKHNDEKKHKSRFYITNEKMKKLGSKLNFRYRILYIKEDAKVDPNYLKKMKLHLTILQALKKYYDEEDFAVKQAIIVYSQAVRKHYKEINDQLPLNG